MVEEQELTYGDGPRAIVNQLATEGEYFEKETESSEEKKENNEETNIKAIELKFFGDPSLLSGKRNRTNRSTFSSLEEKDKLIIGRYKDIYIGGLNLDDPSIREKFGLNKYKKDCFYIGQWKNNLKEGIGFLKISKNKLYLGEFKKNQIDGFGILYYKNLENIYFGTFEKGKFLNGVYYNDKKGLFYRGGFENNQKNDEFCTFFDIENQQIFVGGVKNDDFYKGYVSFCEVVESMNSENENCTDFSAQTILYFDKSNKDNVVYKHYFTFSNDFYIRIQDIYSKIFGADYNIKDLHENLVAYFNNLENVIYNSSYLNNISRYVPDEDIKNVNSIENIFINNYKVYYERINKSQEELNLDDYRDIMKGPELNPEFQKIDLE